MLNYQQILYIAQAEIAGDSNLIYKGDYEPTEEELDLIALAISELEGE